jgi:transposase
MSLTDISEVVRLNWKTIKEIDRFYILKKKRNLVDISPRRLGIDEVAYEKGHKYLTIIRDLDLDAVIWIGKDRRQETLDRFFDEIGEFKASQIELIIVDMHDPYIASIKDKCPHAKIIIDKFHVVKVINKALDEIRKEEFSNASDEERKKMKHKRFLILRRNENLNDKQREQLEVLMNTNNRLYQAYLLKEQVADILDENIMVTAINRMKIWKENVLKSGFQPMEKALKTIERYYDKIENYFKYPYTNAGSEGFNNKIGVIKRRAYGFWDLDYFMLKIFQTCRGLVENDT